MKVTSYQLEGKNIFLGKLRKIGKYMIERHMVVEEERELKGIIEERYSKREVQ